MAGAAGTEGTEPSDQHSDSQNGHLPTPVCSSTQAAGEEGWFVSRYLSCEAAGPTPPSSALKPPVVVEDPQGAGVQWGGGP